MRPDLFRRFPRYGAAAGGTVDLCFPEPARARAGVLHAPQGDPGGAADAAAARPRPGRPRSFLGGTHQPGHRGFRLLYHHVPADLEKDESLRGSCNELNSFFTVSLAFFPLLCYTAACARGISTVGRTNLPYFHPTPNHHGALAQLVGQAFRTVAPDKPL